MNVIGLDLGGEFTRLTMLDAVGETLEEGVVRSTETGFRQRFATMPPSLIAVGYDPGAARLLELLSEVGHSVVLSGPLPEHLRPALWPAVERFVEQGRRFDSAPRSLVLRRSADGAGLTFLLEVDRAVTGAWCFIGPFAPGTALDQVMPAGDAVRAVGGSASEQARRLHALWTMGEISLVPCEAVAAA